MRRMRRLPLQRSNALHSHTRPHIFRIHPLAHPARGRRPGPSLLNPASAPPIRCSITIPARRKISFYCSLFDQV